MSTITQNTNTTNAFTVHFGEGVMGRFQGFKTHLAAVRFANRYLRGNSHEAFARVYRLHYTGAGTVILTDDDGSYYREISTDIIG